MEIGSDRTMPKAQEVMKHKVNSMKMKPNEMWYVDSGVSNHMTNHEEWFSHLEKPKQSGVVETSDDTSHPIEHIGDVPLSHVGSEGTVEEHPTRPNDHQEPKVNRSLSTKECRSDSLISGVSSKKKVDLLQEDVYPQL